MASMQIDLSAKITMTCLIYIMMHLVLLMLTNVFLLRQKLFPCNLNVTLYHVYQNNSVHMFIFILFHTGTAYYFSVSIHENLCVFDKCCIWSTSSVIKFFQLPRLQAGILADWLNPAAGKLNTPDFEVFLIELITTL